MMTPFGPGRVLLSEEVDEQFRGMRAESHDNRKDDSIERHVGREDRTRAA